MLLVGASYGCGGVRWWPPKQREVMVESVHDVARVYTATARDERNRACGVHVRIHGADVPQQSTLYTQDDGDKTDGHPLFHESSITNVSRGLARLRKSQPSTSHFDWSG